MKTIFRFIGVPLFIIAASFIFISSSRKNAASGQGYSTEEALKVLQAIEKAKAESGQPWNSPLREIVVTESELNSYFAYRLETEKEEIMKELRLKLFDNNRIEGKIRVNLQGQEIPRFIRPELNFYFAADVLVSNGLIKLDIKELFLEDEPIQPLLLDMVIAVAARINKQEPASINDWYELPYGIKDIKVQKGKARFYY